MWMVGLSKPEARHANVRPEVDEGTASGIPGKPVRRLIPNLADGLNIASVEAVVEPAAPSGVDTSGRIGSLHQIQSKKPVEDNITQKPAPGSEIAPDPKGGPTFPQHGPNGRQNTKNRS